MEDEYLTYRKFNSEEEFTPFAALLKEKGIIYQVEDITQSLDALFGGQKGREIDVKIKQKDFLIADKFLEQLAQENIEIIDKSYYLYDFTKEELLEVLEKPDEWSIEDIILSRKILHSKGVIINDKKIEELKKKRLDELSKSEKYDTIWKIIGWFEAFMGGIRTGRLLNTATKILPNGEKVYMYEESDRKDGARMYVIGIVFRVLWILFIVIGIIYKIKTSY